MPQMTEATCRRCQYPVYMITKDDGEETNWFHAAGDQVSRGCRSASFDRLGTWDDSLDRKWYAAPVRGTENPYTAQADMERRMTARIPTTRDRAIAAGDYAATRSEIDVLDRMDVKDGAGRKITTWRQYDTWVISQAIRNQLEMFHGGGASDPSNPGSGEGFITDEQMRALNIVIRHTVYEALEALHGESTDAAAFAWFQLTTVNDYMEPPGSAELEAAYSQLKDT